MMGTLGKQSTTCFRFFIAGAGVLLLWRRRQKKRRASTSNSTKHNEEHKFTFHVGSYYFSFVYGKIDAGMTTMVTVRSLKLAGVARALANTGITDAHCSLPAATTKTTASASPGGTEVAPFFTTPSLTSSISTSVLSDTATQADMTTSTVTSTASGDNTGGGTDMNTSGVATFISAEINTVDHVNVPLYAPAKMKCVKRVVKGLKHLHIWDTPAVKEEVESQTVGMSLEAGGRFVTLDVDIVRQLCLLQDPINADTWKYWYKQQPCFKSWGDGDEDTAVRTAYREFVDEARELASDSTPPIIEPPLTEHVHAEG